MAKKINKKVLYILLAVVLLCVLGVGVFGFKYLRERNPQYCLNKARQLFKVGNFQEAGGMFGKAYGRSREDKVKIDILFEMAEFHLTPGEKHEPDWPKAMQCWNTVINIEPENVDARRKLLDFYYQAADNGNSGAWKMVKENASKIVEVYRKASQSPDTELLLTETRAAIAIAQLGSVADRSEMLNLAFANLEQLKKISPDNAKVYSYLAEATTVKGEMDETNGLIGARAAGSKEAEQILRQGIATATDPAEAHANLLEMQLNRVQGDPNSLKSIRAEGKKLAETYPDFPRLLSLMSFAYELHGTMDRRQEMDTAIEYLDKAMAAPGGQTVSNAIRLASLLYRAGDFYQDSAQIQRAFETADKAFGFSDAVVLPGPKEGTARQNRLAIRLFEARTSLDQTLQVREKGDEQAVAKYVAQLNKVVEEIVQAVGENHNLSRMWRGMQLLADNKLEQAYAALYKIYQDMITQDKAGEPSNADSYLCYILSRFSARQGAVGMQREFLEKAIFNRSGIVSEKPRAILEYGGVLLSIQAVQRASEIVESYIGMYGIDKPSGLLLSQIYMQGNQYAEAEKVLTKLDETDSDVISSRLMLITVQINRSAAENKDSADALSPVKLKLLHDKQALLLNQLLETSPEKVESSILLSVCREAVSTGNTAQAKDWVERFLAKKQNDAAVVMLKKELAEPDPKSISSSRRIELYEQTLSEIQDPVQKMKAQVRYCRSMGKNEQAKELFPKLLAASPDDMEAAGDYFAFLLEQKDIPAAEAFFGTIRGKNPDDCEGRLFAAQLEISKKNYVIALQRLEECLTQRPALSVAVMLKSQVYQQQGKIDEAVEAAKTAFQIDPRNPMMARQLSSVLFDRNRQLGSRVTDEQAAEAEQAIGIAMVLSPSDWQLQSVYAETVSDRDPQRGLAVRQSLLKSVPNVTNAAMLGNMAMRLARAETDPAKRDGFVQIAADAFERGWQMDAADPLIQASYAEFLRQTNQSQKAVEIFGNNTNTLWRFYLADGQYDKALAVLEKEHQQKPEDIQILQGLVEACQGLNLWDAMKTHLDTMATQEMTADQHLWLIQKYLDGGFGEPAEKQLAAFEGRFSSDTRVQLLYAWLEMTRGNLDTAMSKTTAFLEKQPDNAAAWRLKGRIYRLMNQSQDAIDALVRSKNIAPDTAVTMELVALYNQTGQIEAAAGELNKAIQEPQASPQLRRMLESLYLENQRTGELAQFYKTTLEKFPNDPFWMTRLGSFYLQQEDYAKAIPVFEKAWGLTQKNNMGDPMALDNYLSAMVSAGNLDAAIAVASKYVDGPLSPVAYWNIAMIQSKQNQPQKATESFAKALEKTANSPGLLMPTLSAMGRTLGDAALEKWCTEKLATDASFIPAHLILAGLAEKAGAYNKAISYINTCIEKSPQNSPQRTEFSARKANILIQAYAKTADTEYLKQAVSQLEAALKINPGDPTLLNNMAYLLADNEMDLNKALEYARRAYQAAPGNPVLLDTYAYVLCKTGDFAQAEKYMTQVLLSYQRAGTPPPWDVYRHQGMALRGLKKNKDALAAFEKAMELGKDIPDQEKQALTKAISELK